MSSFNNKFQILPHNTAYIVVDFQERLTLVMPEPAFGNAVRTTAAVIEVCNIYDVPVVEVRQYPKGLGDTHPGIKASMKTDHVCIDKTSFSAFKVPEFVEAIRNLNVENILVSGMEAHACILHTCLDLMKEGYNVHIISDIALSRFPEDRKCGIEFLRDAGAVITSAEIVMFQLMQDSKDPNFKHISKIIKNLSR